MRNEGLSRVGWAVAASTLWAVGCGSVGEPRPPLLNVPEAPAEFTATQESDQALLRWVWPQRTTSGELLRREIATFEVFAVDIARDSQPTAELLDRLGATIERINPEETSAEPGQTIDVGTSLTERFGKRTAIAVRARTVRGKHSPWSRIVVLDVVRPPDAPRGLRAATAPDGVRLRWNATDRAASYVIEKRVSDSNDFQIAGRTEEREFLDRSIVWGDEHEYRVRAEAEASSGNVSGRRSSSVVLQALDTFAPAPPDQLRAVVAQDSVELTWSSSEAHDLAGYRVLRNGEPLHQGLLESPDFSDRTAGRAQTWNYVVVAVDRTGNESPASDPVQVQVR